MTENADSSGLSIKYPASIPPIPLHAWVECHSLHGLHNIESNIEVGTECYMRFILVSVTFDSPRCSALSLVSTNTRFDVMNVLTCALVPLLSRYVLAIFFVPRLHLFL